MKKKPFAERAQTLAQVERSLALKEAHLPRLQASTIPKELQQRFVESIEQQRARLAQLQGGTS